MILDTLKSPTPVQSASFAGKSFLVKRDDFIHPYFSGNKARKFWQLFNFDFTNYNSIHSFGGNQSNAMLSLAAFANIKKIKFDYFIKPLPKFLKAQPTGNFKTAIELGMQYTEIQDFEQLPKNEHSFFVPQGGAQPEAEFGIRLLAEEIATYASENLIAELKIFLPSGTGTTALFLSKHSNFEVITTPVVGNSAYLRKQFSVLEKNTAFYPSIIDTEKKYAFGKLYPELYERWQQVCQSTKIEFELLYDPKAFLLLEKVIAQANCPVMYIHQGGILGNESMIARYKRYFRK